MDTRRNFLKTAVLGICALSVPIALDVSKDTELVKQTSTKLLMPGGYQHMDFKPYDKVVMLSDGTSNGFYVKDCIFKSEQLEIKVDNVQLIDCTFTN